MNSEKRPTAFEGMTTPNKIVHNQIRLASNDMNLLINVLRLKTPVTTGVTGVLKFIVSRLNYFLFKKRSAWTAQATVQPTMGLLPIPRKPIIST